MSWWSVPPVSSMPPQVTSISERARQQHAQSMQHPHAYGQPPSGSFGSPPPAAERPSSAPAGAGQYVMAATAAPGGMGEGALSPIAPAVANALFAVGIVGLGLLAKSDGLRVSPT